jgi:hypothetical protein
MTKFLRIFNYYQIIIHNYKKFTFEVFPDDIDKLHRLLLALNDFHQRPSHFGISCYGASATAKPRQTASSAAGSQRLSSAE